MADIAQFRRHILALSNECVDYNVAIQEWNKPTPHPYPDGDGVCICGQRNISNMYILTHATKKGTFVEIGCNCAERVFQELCTMECKYCYNALSYKRQCDNKEMCGTCEHRARTMGSRKLYNRKEEVCYIEYTTKNTKYVEYPNHPHFSRSKTTVSFPFNDIATAMCYGDATFERIARSASICDMIIANYENGTYKKLPNEETISIHDLLLYIEVYHYHPLT